MPAGFLLFNATGKTCVFFEIAFKRLILQLGGGFTYFFIFTPKIGEDSHFDEHIIQMGWFNHQPVQLAMLHMLVFAGPRVNIKPGRSTFFRSTHFSVWFAVIGSLPVIS